MIYTLTANPAIDYNVMSDGLAPNTITRTRDAVYSPNGKGLNVSFTLDHFGVPTCILGFFAGFSGEFIVEGAREKGVEVKPVWTRGITRINVFLHAGANTEYNMVNAGSPICRDDERAMLDLLDSLDDLDCLVISGSQTQLSSRNLQNPRIVINEICSSDLSARHALLNDNGRKSVSSAV